MPSQPEVVTVGDVSLDPARRTVQVGDRALELTPSEFELLSAFARHPGQVFTRLQLLDLTQGEAYEGYERTIDQHIKNLRKKIEPDHQSRYILTVHGVDTSSASGSTSAMMRGLRFQLMGAFAGDLGQRVIGCLRHSTTTGFSYISQQGQSGLSLAPIWPIITRTGSWKTSVCLCNPSSNVGGMMGRMMGGDDPSAG
jgi:hypothetical protein